MSDAVDELDFWGRQVLKRSQVNPLREQMEAYVADSDPEDLEQLRQQTSGDTDLSDVVQEGRDERI
jgi:hypothetical protein